jgi:hypothetical protein
VPDLTRVRPQSLNTESPDERTVRVALRVAVEVALVPGDSKWSVRQLGPEYIELGVLGSPAASMVIISTGP